MPSLICQGKLALGRGPKGLSNGGEIDHLPVLCLFSDFFVISGIYPPGQCKIEDLLFNETSFSRSSSVGPGWVQKLGALVSLLTSLALRDGGWISPATGSIVLHQIVKLR
jgi:hypothetical protein